MNSISGFFLGDFAVRKRSAPTHRVAINQDEGGRNTNYRNGHSPKDLNSFSTSFEHSPLARRAQSPMAGLSFEMIGPIRSSLKLIPRGSDFPPKIANSQIIVEKRNDLAMIKFPCLRCCAIARDIALSS